ncbi:MAG: hypothetical protein ACYCSN_19315 [Acidobacteriaceae bacterium]
MHRRFGLPHIAGDNYKDLSAGWMLHSPDPEVFLDVSPSLSGPSFSFEPRLLQSDTRHTGDLDLSARRIAEIRKAYKVVLLDLLRPVCVRDSYINALGVLGDNPLDEALLAYDERNDRHVYAVEYHHTAGYAMPPGFFGESDWPTVRALVKNLGDGDMAAGRKALIQRLQQPAIHDAAQAGWPVQRLMLMANWEDRTMLASHIGLRASDVARLESEMAARHSDAKRWVSIVDEMTDEASATAVSLLARLVLGGGGVASSVRGYRVDRACREAWAALVAIAKEDFPHDALPKKARGIPIDEIQVELKTGFAACGRTDLVAWVDSTAAMPGGVSALNLIVDRLMALAQQETSQIDTPVKPSHKG